MNLIEKIKSSNTSELQEIAQEIRERILEVVSKNGGHLSSSLGAVEIIIAMHYVFDGLNDPFIYDVSHQAYAHKLITGRWDEFESLRQFGGISGFTKPCESEYDYFIAGHSSTSISLALGAAKAIRLKNEDRVPVVLIGDGSMTAGMVYEAMNELGERKHPMVIIINDNEMSIGKAIGAISRYLSKIIAGKFYQNIKQKTEKVLNTMPDSFRYMAKKFEESLMLITPGILFEELGLDYIGPVDGHDFESMIETLKTAKEMKRPVVVHMQTTKGKGYKVAEGRFEKWHGVSPFDIESGELIKKSSKKSATDIFSDELYKIASEDDKVVGVTAAMPSGTGMGALIDAFPDRFWDVAIAEQHAVTSMASLAKEGFKPFCAIYSTFLQRAYDQIIHDVAISSLPVKFIIDRAGIVGEDGETHQGVFDISFLRTIPNMVLFAPRDDESLRDALWFSLELDKPCAIRIPRGPFADVEKFKSDGFELGKSELLRKTNSNVIFAGYGAGVNKAIATAELLKDMSPAILDLRFIKPLDEETLKTLANEYKNWFIFSDSAKQGGVASALMEFFSDENIFDIKITSFEYEDIFLPSGKTDKIEEFIKIQPCDLAIKVKKRVL
ncbi:MAG: 1-deoxy-D-xylulose-5-phosphate synthase [Campylobacterota bacterium]|nr:1-deoxy-D-xylulose-5-phosphate synthase [Campylobacterota bacterium]